MEEKICFSSMSNGESSKGEQKPTIIIQVQKYDTWKLTQVKEHDLIPT